MNANNRLGSRAPIIVVLILAISASYVAWSLANDVASPIVEAQAATPTRFTTATPMLPSASITPGVGGNNGPPELVFPGGTFWRYTSTPPAGTFTPPPSWD